MLIDIIIELVPWIYELNSQHGNEIVSLDNKQTTITNICDEVISILMEYIETLATDKSDVKHQTESVNAEETDAQSWTGFPVGTIDQWNEVY